MISLPKRTSERTQRVRLELSFDPFCGHRHAKSLAKTSDRTHDCGTILVVAAVAFLAAIAGVFAGRLLLPTPEAPASELHELLHHGLKLDSVQQARLDDLEQRFAVRRRALELELRADNARLADAIEIEHGNGPRVAAAVDASHQAMGELQKETLAHTFAMRQILRPDQQAAFDRAVVKALTTDAR